jgi:FixJ family two-component response regulator
VTAATTIGPSSFVALIEDEPLVVHAVKLMVGTEKLRVARTVEEAKLLVLVPECMGILADVGLPDGSGTAVVAHAQAHGRWLPTLFLTGRADYSANHEVARHGARFVLKPAPEQLVIDFVEDALHPERSHRAILDAISREWSERYRASPTESAILHAVIHGASREDLDEGGRSIATMRTHITHLLQKTGDENLNELGRRADDEALRRAFAKSRPPLSFLAPSKVTSGPRIDGDGPKRR